MIELKELKRALVSASLELFRTRGDEVHLAERQNVQLMDAGVRVRAGDAPCVSVVIRSQRNDAPSRSEAEHYDMARARAASLLAAGFVETATAPREIRSVSDASHLLDVWYEVTMTRAVTTPAEAVAEARRALAIERYIL